MMNLMRAAIMKATPLHCNMQPKSSPVFVEEKGTLKSLKILSLSFAAQRTIQRHQAKYARTLGTMILQRRGLFPDEDLFPKLFAQICRTPQRVFRRLPGAASASTSRANPRYLVLRLAPLFQAAAMRVLLLCLLLLVRLPPPRSRL
eukprot:Rmarinus@m.3747